GGYGVGTYVLRADKGNVLAVLVSRPLDTFRSETWELVDGKPVKLNLPERVTIRGAVAKGDPRLGFTGEGSGKINGKDVPAGSLLAAGMWELRPQPATGPVNVAVHNGDDSVFEPTARQSIEDVAVFDDRIVATIYDNVRGSVQVFTDAGEFGGWSG